MKPLLLISLALILLLMVTAGCTHYNQLLETEVINQTMDVEGHYDSTTISIPLEEGRVFELIGGTNKRGSPKIEIAIEYSYWVNSNNSDKFGTYDTSHSNSHTITLGTSDDNTNIDKIFVIPNNANSASIHIYTLGYPKEKSTAKISVLKSQLPIPPVPPDVGSIVNCSRYNEIINDRSLPWEVLQPGVWYSSDGSSWFDLPGNPDYRTFRIYGYSYYASDKYTTYTFPANLSIINKENDICLVIP